MQKEETTFFINDFMEDDVDEIKEPENEKVCRKHFKNMTKEERLYLLTIKDRLLRRGVTFAKHALDRMDERFIKEKDVLRALKNGQILEYKKTDKDEVIAVRGCHINRRNEQVYVIFSISHNKVITTYSNKHWTAYKKMKNLEKYDTNFSIEIPEYYKRRIQFYYAK